MKDTIEVKETITEIPFEPGKVAYNAYCSTRSWKSVRGDPLPTFSEQSLELQDAWNIAAKSVIDYYLARKRTLEALSKDK